MESGDFQLSERTRLREERDTLKLENADLVAALGAYKLLFTKAEVDERVRRFNEYDPPDAARKEQG
jgi:hypothetical protein